MPFITEELWSEFTGRKDMLISAKWPDIRVKAEGKAAQDEMNWLVRLISSIRTIRSELNVPAASQIPLQIKDALKDTLARLERHNAIIIRLGRLSGITQTTETAKGSAQTVLDEATLILPLAGVIDIDQERARLGKEAEKMITEIRKIEAKLGNKDFTDRAPAEVVDEQRERKAEAEATLSRLSAAQMSLAG
jgi:valyl-tRNA synthetase